MSGSQSLFAVIRTSVILFHRFGSQTSEGSSQYWNISMKLQGCGLNTSLTRMCHSHMLTSWPTGGNQSQHFRMIHRHKLYNERSMKVTGKAALMTLKPHVPGADKYLLLKFAFFRSKNNNYANFSHSFTLEWAKNVALCKRNHNRRLSTTEKHEIRNYQLTRPAIA